MRSDLGWPRGVAGTLRGVGREPRWGGRGVSVDVTSVRVVRSASGGRRGGTRWGVGRGAQGAPREHMEIPREGEGVRGRLGEGE